MKKGILKKFLQNDGFTLIELLMVVIILGILAAVVIPQFTSSSDDAKISALKSDLNAIRGALELYLVQHDSVYPDANIAIQLTRYTDQLGNPSRTKTSTYKYGPYLKQGLPKNPFSTKADRADAVYIDSSTTQIGTVTYTSDPNYGWIYVPSTGEFIANSSGYDQY